MKSNILSPIKTFAIQLVILVLLLGTPELGARLYERIPGTTNKELAELNLWLQPYMMFTARSGGDFTWHNNFTNSEIPSQIQFNNLGFAENFDYMMVPSAAYLQQHGKKPGERLVLITGGSVVHGLGATSNENTIAGQMMRYLNEHSNGTRYRVLNMGMGSWIAYQQFIGLSLFGRPLDPDWIVVMDGNNDAMVPCVHGSGVANPLEWPKMLYLTEHGPSESSLMKNLARRSALVRVITGLDPATEGGVPRNLIFDNKDPDKRFSIKMDGLKLSDQDTQLDFYVQSQQNVLALFHRANIILSSQPNNFDNAVSRSYRPAFTPGSNEAAREALEADLDSFMAKWKDKACTAKMSGEALGYFMGRSATRLAEFAVRTQATEPSRRIIYINTEAAFPFDVPRRQQYFIDNAHMSDAGQQRIGELFAEMILSADSGEPFNYAAFVGSQ